MFGVRVLGFMGSWFGVSGLADPELQYFASHIILRKRTVKKELQPSIWVCMGSTTS